MSKRSYQGCNFLPLTSFLIFSEAFIRDFFSKAFANRNRNFYYCFCVFLIIVLSFIKSLLIVITISIIILTFADFVSVIIFCFIFSLSVLICHYFLFSLLWLSLPLLLPLSSLSILNPSFPFSFYFWLNNSFYHMKRLRLVYCFVCLFLFCLFVFSSLSCRIIIHNFIAFPQLPWGLQFYSFMFILIYFRLSFKFYYFCCRSFYRQFILTDMEVFSENSFWAAFTLIYIWIVNIISANKIKYKWPHLYIKTWIHKKHRLFKNCE